MKKFLITAFGSLIAIPLIAGTFEIPEESVHTSSRLENRPQIVFEEGEFVAHVNDTTHKIDARNISGLPKDIREDQLKSFLTQGGYFQLETLGDDYSLKAHVEGLGGNPLLKGMLAVGLGFLLTQEIDVLMVKYQLRVSDLLQNLVEYLSNAKSPSVTDDIRLVRKWRKQILSGEARAAFLSMKSLLR
ncbi:MAG: hypothetical protein A2621_01640 [Alphaproteobacteria bacterium RIFCSPHIGHO2_01_FULL_41_14]|nr:MAG: hypothetical protein A2065_01695 [Alphaproteobacteria bacterium GWB1_45_5]OFW89599.1 MAG: hypothetical protein A2621_01640 [Alphaproteobacteria bacterium RIFCSPHIGHO2_01_FULL_41_14]HCI48489.1 hypothetical protein [Holosporales bacterium]